MIGYIIEKTGMRAIPALIFFVLFIVFIIPMNVNIINIGNCFGAAVTGLLSLGFIFYGPLIRFFAQIWNTGFGKTVLIILSCIAIIGTISVTAISIFMLAAKQDHPDTRPSTLVVLGCKVNGKGPSLMLKRRLDTAYNFLEENPDVVAVVSGGKGSDEQISEAECMRDYLVNKGISKERIYLEDKSASTNENLYFSKKIIEENNLENNITIVTDGFHQLRAELIADNLNMKSYNLSSDTPLWLVPTYWVREWFGIAYYLLFG